MKSTRRSTLEIHKILMDNKEIIIQKEKDGVPIKEIAQEYKVHPGTIYYFFKVFCRIKRMREIDVMRHKEEIIRIIAKKDIIAGKIKDIKDDEYFKELEIRTLPFKKRISPKTLAKMKENTKINNQYIKYYKVGDKEYQNLTSNSYKSEVIKSGEVIE